MSLNQKSNTSNFSEYPFCKPPSLSAGSLRKVSLTSTMDEFQLVASGQLREADQISGIYVGSNGLIYREQIQSDVNQLPYSPIPLGQISANGDYFLFSDKKRGNTLNSKDITRLDIDISHAVGTWGATLRQSWSDLAAKNSEISWIRQNLTQQGIDGRGITVGVCEGNSSDAQMLGADDVWHARTVSRIINSPRYGVAPGASVVIYPFLKAPPAEVFNAIFSTMAIDNPFAPLTDNRDDLNLRLVSYYTNNYNNSSDKFKNILKNKSSSLRVLNLSVAFSRVELYASLKELLESKIDQKSYTYPKLRAQIIGSDANVRNITQLECLQACVRYVDKMINTDISIQQSRHNYQVWTKKLADQGIIIVTGTGNEHDSLPDNVQIDPGYDLNELAKSPYVIVVANSDSNKTPGYLQDDHIASISSQAAPESLWQPTIAAPGSSIKFEPGVGLHVIGTSTGASFSTPYVSAVVAMMLQQNPTLSFSQIKSILQDTATPIPYPLYIAGAGIVNPINVINRAKMLSKA